MTGYRLPNYTSSLPSDSPTDQLIYYQSVLEEAKDKEIVSDIPENIEDTYNVDKHRVRIQTIASRLWLLGYIKNKINPDRIQKNLKRLKRAVTKFQGEANLEPDSWVGPITWNALDELVSFESDLSETNWFENGEIKRSARYAVHRAIKLRLWCLGLHEDKPIAKRKFLKKNDLLPFLELLKAFRLWNNHFMFDFNYDTLRLLFDQDYLSKAILRAANKTGDFFPFNPDIEKEQRVIRFIRCSARIELWLLGLDVNIHYGEIIFKAEIDENLHDGLIEFYMSFKGYKEDRAFLMSKLVTPSFFKAIVEVNVKVDDEIEFEVFDERLAEQLKSDTNLLTKAWQFIKGKGLRIWDGMKRLWRWVKKRGKKIFDFLEKNVFRALFYYTSKAYEFVKKGFSEITKSIGTYIRGGYVLPGMFVSLKADMDSEVYISNTISSDELHAGMRKMSMQSKAFNLACQIVGVVFSIFKKGAIGIVGWPLLLYSLIKEFKNIKALYQNFKLVANY